MAINENNVVGDGFWANIAAENIYNAFDKRKAAVEKLQTTIQWVFGLFGSGGLILTFFAKTAEYNTYLLGILGIGFGLLVIAYFQATTSTFPVIKTITPNEAKSIYEAYNSELERIDKRFRRSVTFASIGFFIIALGITFQFSSVSSPSSSRGKDSKSVNYSKDSSKGKHTCLYDSNFVKLSAKLDLTNKIVDSLTVKVNLVLSECTRCTSHRTRMKKPPCPCP
jgi:hypothetical protein